MRTKSFNILNILLCFGPISFLLITLIWPIWAELQSPGSMRALVGITLLLIACMFCLVLTLICVLLRFVLYAVEYRKYSDNHRFKGVLKAFAHEPYHNIPERASDVAMTAQAVLAAFVFMLLCMQAHG